MAQMVAQMAGFRGVGRIDKDQGHASRFCLIGHKLPQLIEAPTVVGIPVLSAHLRPLPDARQIFEGNLALCRLGLLDKLLTDAVVNCSHMALFFAREPFQKPPGFFRAFALERAPDLGMMGTQLMYRCSFIRRGIGVNSDTASAQVNPQRAYGCRGSRRGVLELDVQHERAITALDQDSTGWRLALESPLLIVAKDGFKPLATVQQCQTKGPIPLTEAKDALVVVNRGGLKSRMDFAFDLERSTHTSDSPDSQIRRQAKLCSHVHVAGMLDLHLVAGMDAACHLGNVVTGIGKGHKSRVEFVALLGGRSEFTGYRAYGIHGGNYITCEHHIQTSAKACKAFPPLPLKRRGFQRSQAQEIL